MSLKKASSTKRVIRPSTFPDETYDANASNHSDATSFASILAGTLERNLSRVGRDAIEVRTTGDGKVDKGRPGDRISDAVLRSRVKHKTDSSGTPAM